MHATLVSPREPPLEAVLQPPEEARTERGPTQEQERGADWPGQQDPTDPGDDQEP